MAGQTYGYTQTDGQIRSIWHPPGSDISLHLHLIQNQEHAPDGQPETKQRAPRPEEDRASRQPPGWVTSFGCANAWPLPKRKEILSQLPQSFVGLLSPHLSPTFCRGLPVECRCSSHCYRLSIFQLPFPLHQQSVALYFVLPQLTFYHSICDWRSYLPAAYVFNQL